MKNTEIKPGDVFHFCYEATNRKMISEAVFIVLNSEQSSYQVEGNMWRVFFVPVKNIGKPSIMYRTTKQILLAYSKLGTV